MRHAAPARQRPLSRAAQLTLAALAYTLAGLSACLTALGAVAAIWGLWQWLGVN